MNAAAEPVPWRYLRTEAQNGAIGEHGAGCAHECSLLRAVMLTLVM